MKVLFFTLALLAFTSAQTLRFVNDVASSGTLTYGIKEASQVVGPIAFGTASGLISTPAASTLSSLLTADGQQYINANNQIALAVGLQTNFIATVPANGSLTITRIETKQDTFTAGNAGLRLIGLSQVGRITAASPANANLLSAGYLEPSNYVSVPINTPQVTFNYANGQSILTLPFNLTSQFAYTIYFFQYNSSYAPSAVIFADRNTATTSGTTTTTGAAASTSGSSTGAASTGAASTGATASTAAAASTGAASTGAASTGATASTAAAASTGATASTAAAASTGATASTGVAAATSTGRPLSATTQSSASGLVASVILAAALAMFSL